MKCTPKLKANFFKCIRLELFIRCTSPSTVFIVKICSSLCVLLDSRTHYCLPFSAMRKTTIVPLSNNYSTISFFINFIAIKTNNPVWIHKPTRVASAHC